MNNELEHLSTELSLIEEQLETKTLPYSDRQLLIQAWNDINMRIEELLEPPKPLEIAPAPPSCSGCETDQPNQLAHMDVGGCLADERRPSSPERLIPEEDVSQYNNVVDTREGCERCSGCAYCSETSYDGNDEI